MQESSTSGEAKKPKKSGRIFRKLFFISATMSGLFLAYMVAGGLLLQKLEVPIPPLVESLILIVS